MVTVAIALVESRPDGHALVCHLSVRDVEMVSSTGLRPVTTTTLVMEMDAIAHVVLKQDGLVEVKTRLCARDVEMDILTGLRPVMTIT
mgnify:FL=1